MKQEQLKIRACKELRENIHLMKEYLKSNNYDKASYSFNIISGQLDMLVRLDILLPSQSMRIHHYLIHMFN